MIEEFGEADGDVWVLHGVFPSQFNGCVDGRRAEELEGFVDEDCRHGKDDEEDERDAQDLEWHLLDVEVPLDAVDVGDLAEDLQPVAKLFAPDDKQRDHRSLG